MLKSLFGCEILSCHKGKVFHSRSVKASGDKHWWDSVRSRDGRSLNYIYSAVNRIEWLASEAVMRLTRNLENRNGAQNASQWALLDRLRARK